MPPKKKTPLSGLCHPLALWRYVSRQLEQAPCDHTYKHTQAFFAAYTKTPWETAQTALQAMGGHCDCEVMNNVIPQVVS